MGPALPLDLAGRYVAAAYLVFLAIVLVYVAIMATRLSRIDRELAELARVVDEREQRRPGRESAPAPAEQVETSQATSGEALR